ncbi:ABC transporter substrate-binding protein [Stagnihabitans tardus]|uniref:Extracellular solute-binding protein n=1 Tax=Stagnihabitans tardus TaxID=2699202 RepID=A0AAE4YD99_9RHOB|nr:extracellular solute-binding protein [Stagnihabitans tardus]NBZ87850.1 extracellular solute-binding protein [Stagnihabitans tardus]
MSRLFTLTSGTALALSLVASSALAADGELTVFDWSSFEDPSLFQTYVDKHGDSPTFSIFADDDEAFQKLTSGFKVDVAHPCAQMVQKYRDAGLIEPWDTSKITNYDKIDPSFLNSPIFKDDAGLWYMPTDYAYTAVAYNTADVPAEDVASLQIFADPKYQGRISLPDNADDVWALALLATGVSDWSAVSDEQFKAAADWLRTVHPNVVAYWSDPSQLSQLMASGEVQIAWSWNDAVAILQSEGFTVGFNRQPKEGASKFFCGFVNLKDGPGKEDKAYDFLNGWLDDQTAKALLTLVGYATTQTAGMATIAPEELAAGYADPLPGTYLTQTPIDPSLRDRMVKEFEQIKSGF